MAEEKVKNRRALFHALSVVFIVAVACLLFYKNFYKSGMLMHVDMTFPTTIPRNFSLYAHTWWPFGSIQNIWNTQRVLWSYPLLAAVKVLGLSTSQYLLVLFIGTFALAGASMYALSYSVITSMRTRLEIGNRYAPFVGALFAALIFMYNPFSVSHLWPYFGYPGYAVLPLAFLLLIKAVKTPRAVYVISLAVLIAVAGTGPIDVAWFWLLIIAYLLFSLAADRFRKESLARAVKLILPLAVLYVLLNAMWMVPIARAQFVNKPFVPFYSPQLTQTGLDLMSAQNSVLNNLRFASGWGLPVNPQVSGTAWMILSFALPVFAVTGLLVLRKRIGKNRVIIFWSIMFVVSILLATGSAFILRRPYSYLTLRAPGSASFGWVFRSADRFLAFAPIFYGLVLGLLSARMLGAKEELRKSLAVVMIALVLFSFGPIALAYARTVYNPAQVPSDYEQANNYIERVSAGARPIWMPFSSDGFHYNWAPEKRIGAFDVYSSNANLNNLQDLYGRDSFYSWLESLLWRIPPSPLQILNRDFMLQKNLGSRLFIPFSAKYLIYDTSVPAYRFGETFAQDSSMKLAKNTKILRVYELDKSTPFVRAARKTIRVSSYYDELALVQRLSAEELQSIAFVEETRPIEPKYGVLTMNDYLQGFDLNSSFEQTEGGMPVGWTPAQNDPRVTYSMDSRNRVIGKQSLRVENRAYEDFSLAWVTGREVPVKAGEIYNIETSVKYTNSTWTHVAVEGYDPAAGRWVRLVRCPTASAGGTSGWRNTEVSFWMPAGFTKIRPALAAGWKEDAGKGAAVSWFDDIKISKISDSFYADLSKGSGSPTVTYQRMGPEKYKVRVRGAKSPFVLVFGEAYDPLWQARTSDGKSIDSVRLYSSITGFPVDRTGDFDMTVEYIAQPWFIQGLVISLVSLALCIAFFAFALVRARRKSARGNGPVLYSFGAAISGRRWRPSSAQPRESMRT